MSQFKPNAVIRFELEGVEEPTVERIRKIIETMFVQGAFAVFNGKVVLHFDGIGDLRAIGYDFMKWKKP